MSTNPKIMATSATVITSTPAKITSMVWTGASTSATLRIYDVASGSGGSRLMARIGVDGSDMSVLPEPMMFSALYLQRISSGTLEVAFE